jgi:hypothetical protein
MKDKLKVFSIENPIIDIKQKEFNSFSKKISFAKNYKKKGIKFFLFLMPFAFIFYAVKSKKLFEILELDKNLFRITGKNPNLEMLDKKEYFSKLNDFNKLWSIDTSSFTLNDLKTYSNKKIKNSEDSKSISQAPSNEEKILSFKESNKLNNINKSPLDSNIEIKFDSRLNKYTK